MVAGGRDRARWPVGGRGSAAGGKEGGVVAAGIKRRGGRRGCGRMGPGGRRGWRARHHEGDRDHGCLEVGEDDVGWWHFIGWEKYVSDFSYRILSL
jgi:hypothetical protein